MNEHLDSWQQEVLSTRGNIVLRSGRQVGKSTVISIKAGEYAAKNKTKLVLVIASVERQAQLLFEKLLTYIEENYPKMIMGGLNRPTKHKIKLKNGSVIMCLPTGLTGHGIRGYTIDMLIADEAAFIPEAVWTAVTPMLSTTKGDTILLSTPFGKGGYFYDCFDDDNYTSFHVSSEECERIPKDFLKREKEKMTKLQYAQEYLGEFVDELRQFFPNSLIEECMTIETGKERVGWTNYLGSDVARMGGDENSFVSLQERKGSLDQFGVEFTSRQRTTDTVGRILALNAKHEYKRIYVDDAGVGGGVFDMLLANNKTRRKVVPINNAQKTINRTTKQKRRIIKEDLYDNLLKLMELKKIKLIKSAEQARSLRSIQYEYTEDGRIKIFGKYSHITEGLTRAAWCTKDKTLNISAFC